MAGRRGGGLVLSQEVKVKGEASRRRVRRNSQPDTTPTMMAPFGASLPPPRRPLKLLVATLLLLTSESLISPTGAFFMFNHNAILHVEVRSASPTPHFPRRYRPLPATAPPNDGENDSSSSDDMMKELSRRITDLTETEKSASQTFEAGLQRRVRAVRSSDDLEAEAAQSGTAHLPAIAFDQLLPRQRLSGRTSDPTFGKMLRDSGPRADCSLWLASTHGLAGYDGMA